jgi:hypothetical protein
MTWVIPAAAASACGTLAIVLLFLHMRRPSWAKYHWRLPRTKTRGPFLQSPRLLVSLVAILLGGAYVVGGYWPLSSCNIKGNISATGERIYHLPYQRYYAVTRISLLRGERWFCSEAEARAAGWRRSPYNLAATAAQRHGAELISL